MRVALPIIVSLVAGCGSVSSRPAAEGAWSEGESTSAEGPPDGVTSAAASTPSGDLETAAGEGARDGMPLTSREDDRCPFDLEAMSEVGTLTYLLDGEPEATLRVTPDRATDRDLLLGYVLRDENGYEAGLEAYVCDGAGLRLMSSGSPERRVAFDPPLLVLPLAASDGVQAGSATLDRAEGGPVEFAYRFAFETEDGEPVGPLRDAVGRWQRVRSVLVLERDGSLTEWDSETDWFVADDRAFSMRRRQEIRVGDRVVTRGEEAGAFGR